MSFAKRYIARNIQQEILLQQAVSANLEMVIVVPVCNEPELLKTLKSLTNCERPNCSIEVILVVNESEDSPPDIYKQNDKTVSEVDLWATENCDSNFNIFIIRPSSFPKKHAGVGLARKTGMDEAVFRFHQINKPTGILVSLDADTLVIPNYLTEIYKLFHSDSNCIGTTIKFEHRIDELKDEHQRKGIELYEKYLHYYKNALDFTSHPHAIYTVGSAFAVRADAYIKQGGMSKRQAGEDFYFLHKLTQLGKVSELNSTCVYPSARISSRVPFGTGPVLKKWMDGDQSLKETYNTQAFTELKDFFNQLSFFYKNDISDLKNMKTSHAIKSFLEQDDFIKNLQEIKKNSSSYPSFTKRFFQYFNAFKVLKFLNYTHPDLYPFQDLIEANRQLKSLLNPK